jgi:hypothetical protein
VLNFFFDTPLGRTLIHQSEAVGSKDTVKWATILQRTISRVIPPAHGGDATGVLLFVHVMTRSKGLLIFVQFANIAVRHGSSSAWRPRRWLHKIHEWFWHISRYDQNVLYGHPWRNQVQLSPESVVCMRCEMTWTSKPPPPPVRRTRFDGVFVVAFAHGGEWTHPVIHRCSYGTWVRAPSGNLGHAFVYIPLVVSKLNASVIIAW